MSIKPSSIEIAIYDPADIIRLGELRRDAEEARLRHDAHKAADQSTRTMGDVVEDPKAAEDAFNAFQAEAEERATVVEIRTIGSAHRDIRLAHPPRKVRQLVEGEESDAVHEDDAEMGVNTETYPWAVLLYADPDDEDVRTIARPQLPEAGLKKLLKSLREGDFDRLWTTAYFLNTNPGVDPKALRYSNGTLTSSETSD
jgi:hypothetical protein